MAKVSKVLQLKTVELVTAAVPAPPLPKLDEVVRLIVQATPKVSDRHVPEPSESQVGKRCSFIDRVEDAPGDCAGVAFRFSSYIKGEKPKGVRPNFDAAEADVAKGNLTDVSDGEPREPVLSFNVLALGHVIVVESVRGTGGIAALEKCLTALIRRHVDPEHPSLSFVDVSTRTISNAIDRAGGVREVIMDLAAPLNNPTHKYGRLLQSARSSVGRTERLRLTYYAEDESDLSKEDVLAAYDDLEADEMSKLIIVLKDGTRFQGTEKCRVRKTVTFLAEEPSDASIRTEMARYLVSLQMIHDGVSVVTADGFIG